MDIQVVKSAGGIEAWLVEEHAVPMLSLRFGFEGGSSQDPEGKEGVGNFVACLLNRGGGAQSDAIDVRDQIADLPVRMNFFTDKDTLGGSLDVLTENRHEVALLLRQLLSRRHFDTQTVESIRERVLGIIGGLGRNPSAAANIEWDSLAFAGHTYARPIAGTHRSAGKISPADLEAYCKRILAKDTLKVVAVGDITADELSNLLDDVFAELPSRADLVAVPDIDRVSGGKHSLVEMDILQSGVAFGVGAVRPGHPDYIPAVVLNHIVGGGGANCRLVEEVRQKRGLAHSVSTFLSTCHHASVLRGCFVSGNDAVEPSLDIIRQELQKTAMREITDTDLEDAKTSLIRSFPLYIDANAKIAWQLLRIRIAGLDPSYINGRSDMIADVTLDDLQRVGDRLNTDDLIIAIVGKPVLTEESPEWARSQ